MRRRFDFSRDHHFSAIISQIENMLVSSNGRTTVFQTVNASPTLATRSKLAKGESSNDRSDGIFGMDIERMVILLFEKASREPNDI